MEDPSPPPDSDGQQPRRAELHGSTGTIGDALDNAVAEPPSTLGYLSPIDYEAAHAA